MINLIGVDWIKWAVGKYSTLASFQLGCGFRIGSASVGASGRVDSILNSQNKYLEEFWARHSEFQIDQIQAQIKHDHWWNGSSRSVVWNWLDQVRISHSQFNSTKLRQIESVERSAYLSAFAFLCAVTASISEINLIERHNRINDSTQMELVVSSTKFSFRLFQLIGFSLNKSNNSNDLDMRRRPRSRAAFPTWIN